MFGGSSLAPVGWVSLTATAWRGKMESVSDLGTEIISAVEVLRAGGLVAFPTETVYGLGADADNESALARIFAAKGRPTSHPLIVHIGSVDFLSEWAADVSPLATALADEFWPGPLTLVLRRASRVSDLVTGGQETVALRVPNHPMALELLRSFSGGIAAPSANKFGHVSPTTAEHVRSEFPSRSGGSPEIDQILDGGPCSIGVESTILDLTGKAPRILRPGGVTAEQIDALLESRGEVPALSQGALGESGAVPRVPGALEFHYAPDATVELVEADKLDARRAALVTHGFDVVVLEPLEDFDEYAQVLYQRLRNADNAGADILLAVLPPDVGVGAAIADRLRRAAGATTQGRAGGATTQGRAGRSNNSGAGRPE